MVLRPVYTTDYAAFSWRRIPQFTPAICTCSNIFGRKKTYFDGINSNKHVKSFTMIEIMWGLECNQGWYKAGTKLTYQVKH